MTVNLPAAVWPAGVFTATSMRPVMWSPASLSIIPAPISGKRAFLECLQQPLFLEYRKGQPFNGNHLRPCPMLENPDLLPEMVKRSGARSTDLEAPESAEHLCEKCKAYAACWQPTAEQLWDEEHRQ